MKVVFTTHWNKRRDVWSCSQYASLPGTKERTLNMILILKTVCDLRCVFYPLILVPIYWGSKSGSLLPVMRIQRDVAVLRRFACNTCRLSLSRVVCHLSFVFLAFVAWVVGGVVVFAGLFISCLVLFWLLLFVLSRLCVYFFCIFVVVV